MFKKFLVLLVLACFAFSLAGCATAAKQKDEEIQSLKNQVSLLESQVQSKDEEINGLKDDLAKTQQAPAGFAKTGKCKVVESWTRPKVKDIQVALMNAGYNPGRIDGHMGKQTKAAIREFQKANNLAVDGHVGKKTWELLRGYLEKKVK